MRRNIWFLSVSVILVLGTFVYTYGTLRALARWKEAEWTITVDGETRTFPGYSVAVANSGVFGGGMFLAPDASVSETSSRARTRAAAANSPLDTA